MSGLKFGPIGRGQFNGIGVGRLPLGGKPGVGKLGGIGGKFRPNAKQQARAMRGMGLAGGMGGQMGLVNMGVGQISPAGAFFGGKLRGAGVQGKLSARGGFALARQQQQQQQLQRQQLSRMNMLKKIPSQLGR